MNNTYFTICKANQEQRDYVLDRFPKMKIEERESAIIYVAVNKSDNIIGRILVTENEVPKPLNGKYWYIINIFVHPNFRRIGIATELVNKIKCQAEQSEVLYLYGSANATVEASLFWFNQNFTLNSYGKKYDNVNEPLLYGNYHHFFSYRVERKTLIPNNTFDRIKRASADEIQQAIDTYIYDDKRKSYFLSKSNRLLGFVAIGEDGKIQGAIIAFPDSMQAPLDSDRLWINLFVEPEYRNQGIGKALVYEVYQYAKENDIVQLTNFDTTEDNVGFWYEIGFDIFFWGINSSTGKRGTTAMIRVK
ncbi:MAG: GNAT family N-acetyltransferase [Clostridia bacterium]|nr:GNAT family N-acetyltransferase [Clostridia bacterium]